VKRLAIVLALFAGACQKDDSSSSGSAAPAKAADAGLRLARQADAGPKPVDAAPAAKPVDAAPAAAKPVDAGATAPTHKTKPPAAAPDASVAAAAPDAAPAAPAPGACHRTEFKTKLIKDACAQGGQAAAKAAMKQFVKDARATEPAIECKSCHKSVGGDYPLKDDGFDHFKKLGGS